MHLRDSFLFVVLYRQKFDDWPCAHNHLRIRTKRKLFHDGGIVALMEMVVPIR
jgi:hypothetical protein